MLPWVRHRPGAIQNVPLLLRRAAISCCIAKSDSAEKQCMAHGIGVRDVERGAFRGRGPPERGSAIFETRAAEGSDTAPHHPSEQFHFRYKDLKYIHLPPTAATAPTSAFWGRALAGGPAATGKTRALTSLRTNRGWMTQPLLICLDGAGKFSSVAGTRDRMVASVKLGHRAGEAERVCRDTWRAGPGRRQAFDFTGLDENDSYCQLGRGKQFQG